MSLQLSALTSAGFDAGGSSSLQAASSDSGRLLSSGRTTAHSGSLARDFGGGSGAYDGGGGTFGGDRVACGGHGACSGGGGGAFSGSAAEAGGFTWGAKKRRVEAPVATALVAGTM